MSDTVGSSSISDASPQSAELFYFPRLLAISRPIFAVTSCPVSSTGLVSAHSPVSGSVSPHDSYVRPLVMRDFVHVMFIHSRHVLPGGSVKYRLTPSQGSHLGPLIVLSAARHSDYRPSVGDFQIISSASPGVGAGSIAAFLNGPRANAQARVFIAALTANGDSSSLSSTPSPEPATDPSPVPA